MPKIYGVYCLKTWFSIPVITANGQLQKMGSKKDKIVKGLLWSHQANNPDQLSAEQGKKRSRMDD